MSNFYDLYDRIKGALIGVAYGDAMGMATECESRSYIRERFPLGINRFYPSDPNDVMGREIEAYKVTDDTINTVMILNMIVEQKGSLSAEAYVKKLMKWLAEDPIAKEVSGPSTIKAINAIQSGIDFRLTGRTGTTNGASMRITSIGIISDYSNLNDLNQKVYQICVPTHNTSIAIAGACAIASSVSYALSGKSDLSEMWDIAINAIESGSKYGYDFPAPSLVLRMKYLKEQILINDYDIAIEKLVSELGTGVETIETIPAVYAVINLAKGDPLMAAKISAELGWDTDTIGAISTGICGAMHPKFSETDIKKLEYKNNLNFGILAENILPYSPWNNQ